jgi:fatty acid desaturase
MNIYENQQKKKIRTSAFLNACLARVLLLTLILLNVLLFIPALLAFMWFLHLLATTMQKKERNKEEDKQKEGRELHDTSCIIAHDMSNNAAHVL